MDEQITTIGDPGSVIAFVLLATALFAFVWYMKNRKP